MPVRRRNGYKEGKRERRSRPGEGYLAEQPKGNLSFGSYLLFARLSVYLSGDIPYIILHLSLCNRIKYKIISPWNSPIDCRWNLLSIKLYKSLYLRKTFLTSENHRIILLNICF